MRFLQKVNRNFLILFMLVLAVASGIGYLLLKQIILNESKETLLGRELLVINQIGEKGEIPNFFPVIEVKKIDSISVKEPEFKEVFINDPKENELEPYIEYYSQKKINNSFYSIQIRQATYENKDLLLVLAVSLFIFIVFIFGISFLVNRKMNRTIWADFEANLHEIERFNFSEYQGLKLKESGIEEFDRLNKVINHLTEKLKTDYKLLKEFTENASHEIQTPLSVVLINLEEVLQHDLSEEIFKKVASSISAAKRLSTLNQSLLLLSKIENRQYISDKTFGIHEIVKRKLGEFESLFETKKLLLEFHVEKDFTVKMNEHLFEILMNNLLSNAIHHNVPGGIIRINIKEQEFQICNSGNTNELKNENIFNRFTKGNSNSVGLGLAIVKQICITHQLEINYLKEDMHCFIIKPINTKMK